MKYSVIMTCWGKLDEITSRCLPTFYETEADWELIVVDNNSPDGTGEWLARHAQSMKFIKPILLEENRGYAGGLSAGMDVAKGDFIVCMNNDIFCVKPTWLDTVFEPIRYKSNRLVGPRLILDNWMTDVGDGPIPYLEGWLIAADREFWEKSRGWDTRYNLAWFEDVDLSWRAVQLGYELYEHPDVPVMHMFGRTAYQSGLDFHNITQNNKAQFSNVYFGVDLPWHEVGDAD